MKSLATFLLAAVFAVGAFGYETSDVNYSQSSSSSSLSLVWEFELTSFNGRTCAMITGVKNSGETDMVVGDLSVPESVMLAVVHGDETNSVGYIVKEIAADAFANQLALTSISLPSTVEKINAPFCAGCTLLNAISVDSANPWFTAFGGMLFDADKETLVACPPTLESVTLPSTMTAIGADAFTGCFRLKSLAIPAGVDTIGDRAFAGCAKLKSITFEGDAPAEVGADIFGDAAAPDVIYISRDRDGWPEPPAAWQGVPTAYTTGGQVSGVTSATSGNVTWYYHVVDGKAELYNNGQSCIGAGVSETSTWDSENAVWVGDGSLVIPSSLGGYPVSSIGSNAFVNCSALAAVTIPQSITEIGAYAFRDCSGLTALSIPESVRKIGRHPFAGSSMTALALPTSLRELDGNPLAGCETFLTVSIDSDNSYYAVSDGLLYDKDVALLVGCPARKEGATIAASATAIGEEAFSGCFRLSTLSVPDTVVELGAAAFSDCERLTKVTFLGDEPTAADDLYTDSAAVVTYAYAGKSGWSGDEWKARPLTIITVGGDTDEDDPVGVQEYTDADGNTWLYTVENGIAQLGAWGETPVLADSETAGAVSVPDTLGGYPLVKIPDEAFCNCSNVTKVTISSAITEIAATAFNGCSALAEIAVATGNKNFAAKYRCLYSKDGATLLKVPAKFRFPTELTTSVSGTIEDGYVLVKELDAQGRWQEDDFHVLTAGETVATNTVYQFTPSITPAKLLDGVSAIADNCFTDCGRIAAGETVNGALTVTENGVIVKKYSGAFAMPIGTEEFVNEELAELKREAGFYPTMDNGELCFFIRALDGRERQSFTATVELSRSVTNVSATAFADSALTATYATAAVKTLSTVVKVASASAAAAKNLANTDASTPRRVSQAYVEVREALGEDVKSASGLPTGLKFKNGYATGKPTKVGTFAVKLTRVDRSVDYLVWEITRGENSGVVGALEPTGATVNDSEISLVAGLAIEWPLEAVAGAKVSASGLPAGLKLVKDRATGAYAIAGAATRAGEFTVTFKTVANGVTVTEKIRLVVASAPAAALGAFVGCVKAADGEPCGAFSATVTAAGKASGKIRTADGDWTFSWTGFTSIAADGAVTLSGNCKRGKTAAALALTIRDGEISGEMSGAVALEISALKDTLAEKTAAAQFKRDYAVALAAAKANNPKQRALAAVVTDADGEGDAVEIALTLKATGAIAAAAKYPIGESRGKVKYASVSCATKLLAPEVGADFIRGTVVLYFPAKKGGFLGRTLVQEIEFK